MRLRSQHRVQAIIEHPRRLAALARGLRRPVELRARNFLGCAGIRAPFPRQGLGNTQRSGALSNLTLARAPQCPNDPSQGTKPRLERHLPGGVLAFSDQTWDGRVAQSAERVCEQHETVVRNHPPAAN